MQQYSPWVPSYGLKLSSPPDIFFAYMTLRFDGNLDEMRRPIAIFIYNAPTERRQKGENPAKVSTKEAKPGHRWSKSK